MLDKYQKEVIIPLLKKDGKTDEEFKFGCVLKQRFTFNYERYDEFDRIISTKKLDGGYSEFVFEKFNWGGPLLTSNLGNKYEIIGQYHLGSLLQFFNKQGGHKYGIKEYVSGYRLGYFTIKEEFDNPNYGGFEYEEFNRMFLLNINTPPMERTEDKNKELAEIMQKVNNR